ncbi:MAG TPA: M56 family metallopeptidase, partial [Flavisolibacter sp.]
MALIAGLVLTVTKRTSPVVRYGVLLSLLLLFTVATVGTFLIQWTIRADQVASAGLLDRDLASSPPTVVHETKTTSVAYAIQIGSWLEKNSGMIMLAWLLCFAVQCTRIWSGVRYMNRLRQSATPVAPLWKLKLEEWKKKIGIGLHVQLMHSPLVKVPVMIGLAKPLILLPISLMSHL